MTLTVGSIFTGIGGIDLGLERAGFQIVWQCEIDAFCQKVLAKHWPNVARYGDIRDCGEGRKHTLARVDMLVGGFPCQDISIAGDREGITGERSGLWSEMYRIVCEIRPRFVLVENVAALLYPIKRNGYIEPAPIARVLGDLAEARYDAEWFCLRASDFGAPHQRERVFIVAHSDAVGVRQQTGTISTRQRCTSKPASLCKWENRTSGVGLADAHSQRLQIRNGSKEAKQTRSTTYRCSTGQLKSYVGGDVNGIPARMDRYHRWPAGPDREQYYWEPSRVIIEKLPHRAARLKALGNAVVPQCAEYIGRLIIASM